MISMKNNLFETRPQQTYSPLPSHRASQSTHREHMHHRFEILVGYSPNIYLQIPIQPIHSITPETKASPARSIAVVSSTQRTMASVQISTVDLELFERDYRDFFHSVAWTLRSSPPGALIVWRVDRSNLFWIRYKVLICCFCYWDCT